MLTTIKLVDKNERKVKTSTYTVIMWTFDRVDYYSVSRAFFPNEIDTCQGYKLPEYLGSVIVCHNSDITEILLKVTSYT